MKILIKTWTIFLFYSCLSTQNTMDSYTELYKIKKIQPKNNWYIIYAEKQDSVFKIISGREIGLNYECEKIKVGKFYAFELKSRRNNVPEISGVKLSPVNYLDIECYSYDKDTEICIEPKKGIYDLYHTNNLKGLCFFQ